VSFWPCNVTVTRSPGSEEAKKANYRSLYIDVTHSLRPGKTNQIQATSPHITGGYLENWPIDPAEMEVTLVGEKVDLKPIPPPGKSR